MWRVLLRIHRVFEKAGICRAERFKEHFEGHCQASSSFNFDTSLVSSGRGHSRGSRGWRGSEKCADDEWRCFFRRSCRGGSNAALEALGWGSALAVGLHLSHIWHNLMQWRMKCWRERHSDGQQFSPWHACGYLTVKSVLEFDGVEAVSPRQLDDSRGLSSGLDHTSATPLTLTSERGHIPLDVRNGTTFATAAEFGDPLRVLRLFGAKDSDIEESVYDKPCIQLEESSLPDLEHEFSEVTRLFDGEALNAEANRLARAGQIGEAVALWERAATEYGCNQSYYNLGVAYQTGKGAKCDKDKALSYFMKAGDLGHVKGKFNAAALLLEQENAQSLEQACFLLEEAAQCGLKEAQTQLASLYLERNESIPQAFQLLAKASAQGHVAAKYMLGVCHEKGLGTEENCCAAADLYRQASEAGHSDATYNLGVFFENGLGGLPVDKAAALSLYSKAADLGDMMAFVDVERLGSDIATESNILHNTMPARKHVVDAVAKQDTLRSSSSCSNIIVTDSCDMPVEHKREIFSDVTAPSAASSAKSRRARFFVGDSTAENTSYHGYEDEEMIRFASLPFQRSLASENNLCLLVN